jgi:hypothetical protein
VLESGIKSLAMHRTALGGVSGSSFRVGGNRHQGSFRVPAAQIDSQRNQQYEDTGTVAHSPFSPAKPVTFRAPATAAAAAVVKAGQRFLRTSVSSTSVNETLLTTANTLNHASSRNLSRMQQLASSQSPDEDESMDASAKPAIVIVTQQQKAMRRNSLSDFNAKYSMTML